MSKVFVIGAGHGGLATAARLRVKGHDVQVYESSPDVVTIPQLLTLPAAYRDLFLKTGTALEDHLELLELKLALEISLANGSRLQMPGSGIGRVLAEIETKLGIEAVQQWREYIGAVGALWIKVRAQLIEAEAQNSPLTTLGLKSFFLYRSFNKLINRYLSDVELKKLTAAYRSQAYVDQDSDLGLLGLNSYVQQAFGVYEPAGGLSYLTNQLKKRCSELGVEFVFNQKVEPVSLDNRVLGIQTDVGTFVSADYVVVNDLQASPQLVTWRNLPSVQTSVSRLYRIAERSWLGLGPAHAVICAEIVATSIGSAHS